MDIISIIAIFPLLGFLAFYLYFKYSYTYWKKRGIPYLEPKFPIGNAKGIFLETPVYTIKTADWYRELKVNGEKFGGVWDLCKPILVVVDPDYIRDILTKDFQHFIDRDIYISSKPDPIRNHLFGIRSDKWKKQRQTLSPTFTSGKMKMMFKSVMDCSENMVKFLEKQAVEGQDMDAKQVMSSFTIDVIASCIFGLDVNSFDNPDDEFRSMGYKLFKDTWFNKKVIYTLIRMHPQLCHDLGVRSTKEGVNEFFTHLVKSTIEHRKKNGVKKNDFIQILLDLYEEGFDNGTGTAFDFDLIVANTVLFFAAGFDTSSTTMAFALYELARNPDVQDKARQEILKVLDKFDGKITYETIGEMSYLRQVVDETLRLYPSVQTLARICTKDYQLRDTNIIIKKGTSVVISPLGLGTDPEYFPNPEKFDPSRFSAEAKAERHAYVHIPFGEGPRNCIGLRFGLMQSSVGLIQVLKNFKVSISSSTDMPLQLDDDNFLLKSKQTLYLRLQKILPLT